MSHNKMIWANLLHLGYNMWEDRDESTRPDLEFRRARPYLRCDRNLWRDLTQQMADAGMNMIVMHIVNMEMIMLQFLVAVVMLMALRKVQPEADCHQHAGDQELRRHRLPQQQDGERRANERCQ